MKFFVCIIAYQQSKQEIYIDFIVVKLLKMLNHGMKMNFASIFGFWLVIPF
jgi:hypothetical protein